MAQFGGTRPAWGPGFVIDGGANDGRIRLAQRGRVTFALESTVDFVGETGLEHLNLSDETMAMLRHVGPEDLPETDLASIPTPMRWWINTYGVHTPAALIHDRFTGGTLPAGVTEQHIDRYFRFMLADSGVRIGKRWIMWAAVAFRTRWASGGAKRVSLILWFALATIGTACAAIAASNGVWWVVAVAVGIVPVAASALWQQQAAAGLIAAYFVFPLLLLPMVLSIALLSVFWLAELLVSKLLEPSVAGTEPTWEAMADTERADERAALVEIANDEPGAPTIDPADG